MSAPGRYPVHVPHPGLAVVQFSRYTPLQDRSQRALPCRVRTGLFPEIFSLTPRSILNSCPVPAVTDTTWSGSATSRISIDSTSIFNHLLSFFSTIVPASGNIRSVSQALLSRSKKSSRYFAESLSGTTGRKADRTSFFMPERQTDDY